MTSFYWLADRPAITLRASTIVTVAATMLAVLIIWTVFDGYGMVAGIGFVLVSGWTSAYVLNLLHGHAIREEQEKTIRDVLES